MDKAVQDTEFQGLKLDEEKFDVKGVILADNRLNDIVGGSRGL